MKTYTATELRKKFHEAYNQVRFGGETILITHHGDDSVIMIRKADLYPEPTTSELHGMAAISGAFDDVVNDPVKYE
jgi:PHD/YefM family antitoxin component YafN of YafNO toxin-antitoxin module